MASSELIKAAEQGNVSRLRELLAGPSPGREATGEALVFAVIYEQLEAARFLLQAGANVDRRDSYGQTPLFTAVTCRKRPLPIIELLLEHGADVRARDTGGRDALQRYLTDVENGSGHAYANVAIVRRLLVAGIDARAPRPGSSPLASACAGGHLEIVEALLAAGADPNAGPVDDNVLWKTIYSRRKPEVLALLVKGGADPSLRTKNAAADTTLLMEVCRAGDVKSAQALLDRGADPNAGGAGTPLSCAEESGNPVLVDLLLERGAVPHQAAFSPEASRALEEGERVARARPDDPAARLGWAAALAAQGFRAAAASEVAAALRLGAQVPEPLAAQLAFEAPPGVRWTFAAFGPATSGVAPRVGDERFVGARVTDGKRTLPLVVTLGAPCAGCDEKGEEVCSMCSGTGSYTSYLDPDHDVDCEPRQTCSACRGLKFVVTGKRFGKGGCRHPQLADEMKLERVTLKRCPSCGLAALYGAVLINRSSMGEDFACGVCGRFACSCAQA